MSQAKSLWIGCLGMLAVLLWGGSLRAAETPRRQPPNLLLILLDNVGQDWFGCCGSLEGQTPEMDQLAANGLRFQHFYTTPFCSTSRVALLTGRYPFRTGWTTHHDAAIYAGGNFDQLREVTFAQVLRSSGYATAIAGKWQISRLFEPDQADALWRHGFDEHCIWPDGPRGHAAHSQRYFDPYVVQNGRTLATEGRYGPDVFSEYLIDFMRRHRDRPFLAYYSAPLTHGPVTATPLNKDQAGLSDRELFAGMVRYADRDIGRLVRALEELNLRDRTIVMVLSDNGNERKYTGRMAGRVAQAGGYGLTEGGIDMPLIVNCPGLVPGGRVSQDLCDLADVLPTLADLAGAALPEGVTLDGHSLADTVLDRPRARPARDWIFSQYAETRVVRGPRFKLYSTGEFFDLAGDPLEQQDLSSSPDEAIGEARRRLQGVLDSLPADARLPFAPRSLSAFELRRRQAAEAVASAPEGWQPFAARDEIAPLWWIARPDAAANPDAYLLGLAGRGDDWVDGRWQRRVAVSGDKHYRFSARYRGTNLAAPARSVLARVLWFDAAGKQLERAEYPATESLPGDDGWTALSAVYRAPSGAAQAQLELHLRWAANAEVLWQGGELTETAAPPPRPVRLAAIHHRPRGSKSPQENLEQFAALIDEAAVKKADIVCLPEGITVVGTGKPYADVAEPIPGPSTEFLGRKAAEHQLYLVAGLYERAGKVIHNTSVLIGRDGRLAGKYRKVCLPSEEIDGGITPGKDYPVFDTDFGRVGMMICWDLSYPEVARRLASQGAEVILMPIWGGQELLARARAQENQLYLVTSGYDFRTAIFDRTGDTLVQAETDKAVIVTEVDLNQRQLWPWLGDWRSRVWREAPANN
ncbi:MAG: sulfatase-like hydrolase/transferase [Pirellulaceae bacterium]|nr:sulfatase-like hydrolase/transferase [Pirellulaceae bacterium]